MKKIIFLLCVFPSLVNAQSLLGGSNVLKVNLSSLALGNYHVTYERSIAKKLSLSISYRFMPKSTLPFASNLEQLIDNPDVRVSAMELGNTAITPELRLYLGKGKLKGFYIAPYARFASFDIKVPITYDNPAAPTFKKQVDFDGTIKSTSAGVMIGIQKHIAKKIVLDFWIIGGHYGSSTGTLNAIITPALTGPPVDERTALQNELNNLKNNGGPFKFEGTVAANGASAVINSTGPWAGVRGAGLCLGIRF